jgi:DinB superfamily
VNPPQRRRKAPQTARGFNRSHRPAPRDEAGFEAGDVAGTVQATVAGQSAKADFVWLLRRIHSLCLVLPPLDFGSPMPVASPRADARWQSALDEHQEALAAYLDAAGRLPESAWTRPWKPGKWTPAQTTEHLAMTYQVFIGEVNGGTPMRLKLTPFRRRLLKLLLLPHMLFHRTFPRGAVAPRELRPAEGSADRDAALRRMRELGERFAQEASRVRASRDFVTHPFFGEIDLTRGMRLCAVHLEHHTRQIAAAKG